MGDGQRRDVISGGHQRDPENRDDLTLSERQVLALLRRDVSQPEANDHGFAAQSVLKLFAEEVVNILLRLCC